MGVRKLYVLPLGFLEHDIGILLDGKSGVIVSPIVSYLMETDDGWVLYDSGADPDVVEDPVNIWGGITKIVKPKIEPSDKIVEVAKESGANLIVMGSYGHSRIREAILGSVTVQTMRKSTCPLLMAR